MKSFANFTEFSKGFLSVFTFCDEVILQNIQMQMKLMVFNGFIDL